MLLCCSSCSYPARGLGVALATRCVMHRFRCPLRVRGFVVFPLVAFVPRFPPRPVPAIEVGAVRNFAPSAHFARPVVGVVVVPLVASENLPQQPPPTPNITVNATVRGNGSRASIYRLFAAHVALPPALGAVLAFSISFAQIAKIRENDPACGAVLLIVASVCCTCASGSPPYSSAVFRSKYSRSRSSSFSISQPPSPNPALVRTRLRCASASRTALR